ncbi:MAG: hypothetical protein ACJ74Z_01420 [Bryobacteraceae bacterium]
MSANSFLSRADTLASAAIQNSGAVLRRLSVALAAHYRPILLSLVIVLIILKAPMVLVRPRLWAEESFYLAYALKHSFLQGLLWSRESVGYYSLTANVPAVIAAIIAEKFSLEYAPFVTTYFSLVVQIVPFAILIFGKSHLFLNRFLVTIGCLVMVVPATNSGEIWFNTINAKNWVGLAAFIILFEDMSQWSNRKTWFFRWVVVFCGLSGPYAAVLAPILALSYFVYRERERLVQAGILGGCCLIDLALLIFEVHAGGAGLRTKVFTWDSAVVNIFYFQAVWAFLGEKSMKVCKLFGLADAIQKSYAVPRGGQVITAAWLCLLAVVVFIHIFWTKKKILSEQTLLVTSFLLFAGFTARSALMGIPSNRYASLPGLALLLLLVSAWDRHSQIIVRVLAIILVTCALWRGMVDYRKFFDRMSPSQPVWREEVQKWRTNPSYAPAVWPIGWAPLDWKPDLHKRK